MRTLLGFAALLAGSVLAGCAAMGEPERIAAADCKIYLREPGTLPSGRTAPSNDDLERQHAISRLATSELRWRMLNRPFGLTGTIEEALRDCGR
jgi:hypothetical protein